MTDSTATSGLTVPEPATLDLTQTVKMAVGQAEILKKAIVEQGLSTRIGGREHINVEGWQLVLALNNVVPVIIWSRRLDGPAEKDDGWEAYCELHDGHLVVGSGFGMCQRSERTWAKRDDYALRSMAETRAIGKACRNRFGFLARIAGFAATPQEEMQAMQPPVVLAKQYALDLAGDKESAKTLYEKALAAVDIDDVTNDEQATAVIAAIGDIYYEEDDDGQA